MGGVALAQVWPRFGAFPARSGASGTHQPGRMPTPSAASTVETDCL